jgi:hypothetical protein
MDSSSLARTALATAMCASASAEGGEEEEEKEGGEVGEDGAIVFASAFLFCAATMKALRSSAASCWLASDSARTLAITLSMRDDRVLDMDGKAAILADVMVDEEGVAERRGVADAFLLLMALLVLVWSELVSP